MENTISQQDSIDDGVGNRWYPLIKTIFDTLLLKKGWLQQNLADFVGVDKSNISKIVNGLYIPDLNTRLKIAKALDTDSALIWRTCDLYNIRKILAEQQRGENENK